MVIFPIRIIILSTLFFSSSLFSQQKPKYSERYPKNYSNGILWINQNYQTADSIIKGFGLETKIVLAIGFPECTRYSETSDFFETGSNNYLYVTFGSTYSNFSSGRFQMKPSFVEKLEQFILSDKSKSIFHPYFLYENSKDEKSKRRKRLARLESTRWQIIYLSAFFSYLEGKYNQKKWSNIDEKIDFFATAYNRGFWLDESEILKWKTISFFPTGKSDSTNNYPYGIVALEFFNNFKFKY